MFVQNVFNTNLFTVFMSETENEPELDDFSLVRACDSSKFWKVILYT